MKYNARASREFTLIVVLVLDLIPHVLPISSQRTQRGAEGFSGLRLIRLIRVANNSVNWENSIANSIILHQIHE
jgi:hypothetical protein